MLNILIILIIFCKVSLGEVVVDRGCVYGDDISPYLPHVKISCGFGFNEERVIPESLIIQKTSVKNLDLKPLTRVRRKGVLLEKEDIEKALRQLLLKYKDINFEIKKINYGNNIYVRSKGEFSITLPQKFYGSVNITLNNGQKNYLIYSYIEAFKDGYVADKKIPAEKEIEHYVRKERVNITNIKDELITDPSRFCAKKQIIPNKPITLGDVYQKYDVKKGETLKI